MKNYIYYIIIVNILSFIFYGIDKNKAKKQHSRISESTLLTLGILGGSLGAIIGMNFFHHKTKKIKFHIINIASLLIWIYISYKII